MSFSEEVLSQFPFSANPGLVVRICWSAPCQYLRQISGEGAAGHNPVTSRLPGRYREILLYVREEADGRDVFSVYLAQKSQRIEADGVEVENEEVWWRLPERSEQLLRAARELRPDAELGRSLGY